MLERSAAVARCLAAGPRHQLGAQPKTPEKVDNKGAEMLTHSSACAWRFLVGAPKVDSLPRWSFPIVRLPQSAVKMPVFCVVLSRRFSCLIAAHASSFCDAAFAQAQGALLEY